jgi:hypothetical protein
MGFLHRRVKLGRKLGKPVVLLAQFCQHGKAKVAGKLKE